MHRHDRPLFPNALPLFHGANVARFSAASCPKKVSAMQRHKCLLARAPMISLLDRLGGDVAGALQLLPPGMEPASVNSGA